MRAVLALGLLAACHVDERFSTLHMTQPAASEPFKVVSWRLKNGIKVAVLRDPRARISSIDLRFDVGTGDDPLALLAGEALALRAGDESELSTSFAVDLDRSELAVTTLDLPHALDLFARRLETTCADLTPELIATARTHAQQQLTGTPPAFVRAVWGEGHPYGHELGDPAQVTPEQLCAFYTSHYGPANATLVITGPTSPELPAQIDARFGALASRALVAQAAVTPVVTTRQRVRQVVFGLRRPTAALAFSVPALGDQDDVMVELAIRRLSRWAEEHKAELHTVTLGGRRGRALVLGIEVEREADLAKAHERLSDILAEANHIDDEDTAESSAEDQLLEAQELDDPFARGSKIADLVASGRRVELLRKIHGFAAAKSPRPWIQDHLLGGARSLDLVPGGDVQTGVSIEALADPASAIDRTFTRVGEVSAPPLPALARPIEDYTLANGLRVLLAADPGATTMDVRLLFPVGIADEPAAGIATRAAAELQVNDGFDAGPDAKERVTWYTTAVQHTDVDVTETATRFRAVGFAALGDWHLFSVAWHVINGTYELASLAAFKRHYVAKGATLIVSGGFDIAAVKPIIDRWYGAWPVPTQPPPHAVPPQRGSRRPITYESGDPQSIELGLSYGGPGHTSGGRGAAPRQRDRGCAWRSSRARPPRSRSSSTRATASSWCRLSSIPMRPHKPRA